MNKKQQISLTEGSIMKSLSGLAIPIMASSFLGTLYNITDMAWIGLLGAKAVAGVGVGGMFVWLLQGIGNLSKMGGQVHTAQQLGQGKKKEAAEYAKTAIQMSIVFGLIFSIICIFAARWLVSFFDMADEKCTADAVIYTQIVCGTMVFPYLNVTFTGLFTAQGDSHTPFLANLVGLVSNMILDPLLILGLGPIPRMEVLGGAIATAVAQMLVTLVFIICNMRSKEGTNLLKHMKLFSKLQPNYVEGILKMGTPTALQGTMYCMISMVLTKMVTGFGSDAVAAQRVGGQIESISWNTADGFAAALNAFVGQNFGAGKMDRVKKGYRISFWTVGIWGLLVNLLFVAEPELISRIFFHEASAIAASSGYLWVIGFGEAFMCVELMTIGALSGLGQTKLCSLISIIVTGTRIPLALILSQSMGIDGIWWALSGTSIAKGIIFYFVFHGHMRKRELLQQ